MWLFLMLFVWKLARWLSIFFSNKNKKTISINFVQFFDLFAIWCIANEFSFLMDTKWKTSIYFYLINYIGLKKKMRAPRLGAITHKRTLNFNYYEFIVVNIQVLGTKFNCKLSQTLSFFLLCWTVLKHAPGLRRTE